MKVVQQRHALAHVVQAPTAGSATFCGENAGDIVPCENFLNRAFSKSKDLAAAFSYQFVCA